MSDRPAAHEDVPLGVKPPHVREFTVRAVLAALAVATLIGMAYPYVVLKLGFGPNISVVSAFFGFVVLGIFSRSYNRWENNLVQTAGTAAGQIAFLCWLLAAFDLMRAEPDSGFDVALTPLQTFLWLSTAGILGVLLAVPLRRHFIEDEKLTFADGVAAGETLILLDSRGPQAKKSAAAMLAATAISALLKVATLRAWLHEHIPVLLNRMSPVTGVGFSLGLLEVGSGMIIGLRICTSMLIGSVASWVLLPLWLSDGGILGADAKKVDVLLWVMWPATGMLVAGGMTALLLKWRSLVASFRSLRGGAVDSGDFPLAWVVVGSLASGALLVWIQKAILDTPVWQSLVAIVLSIPLMLVAMRVLGETNWGPISTMTNVMQALFGVVAPGDLRASMVSSGITGSVAAESEGLMQDYKTGWMIGSTPRVLTWMQLIAVPVGALALALTYPVLIETYGLGGEKGLMSPTSQRWVGFAKILSKGFSSLHPSALQALGVGALLGVVFTVLEQKRSIRTFVPSPTGIGIGMLVPASAVTTMFLGATVEFVWRKLAPRGAAKYLTPVASGFIAGDALMAVMLSIFYRIGIMQPI